MILEKIEKRAEEVLRGMGVTSLPIPVDEIASRLHIQISRAPSKEFSGILIRKGDYSLIGVNSSEVETRQRFTIAHELGHFCLHTQKDTFIDYRDNRNGAERTPRERQANMFAAAILMPRRLLKVDYNRVASLGLGEEELIELANKYHVSQDAMKYRLMNLSLK